MNCQRLLSDARRGLLLVPIVVSVLSTCAADPPTDDTALSTATAVATTAVPTTAVATTAVIAVAAGFRHTCALTSAGGVKCWGANESGQLGNGTTTGSITPVDVTGLASGIVAIAAGGHHTCAVTSAGGVKCWGLNDGGQLGNPGTQSSNTPVDVDGLAREVNAITAGAGWVCALTSLGGVKCWGWNHYGQLGNGTIDTTTSRPGDVSGLVSGVTEISANSLHACALTGAGHVTCWGSTASSDSHRAATDSLVPVNVSGIGDGVIAVSAGGLHACAITSGGGVMCWGANGQGELGDGSTTGSASPVQVKDLTEQVTALAVGSTYDFLPSHTCALTSAGGVKCWGPNLEGQLGNGSKTNSSRPVEASGLSNGITAIAVGGSHTCAITRAQQLKCWGSNSSGQLGNGSLIDSPTPVDVVGF